MMEEKEIDLLDLLADVLSHWRGVLVWMIIGALVFGAVDYMMSANVIKEVEEQAAEDFPGEEITTELIAESIVARELQEAQRTAVLITIDDEEELEKRRAEWKPREPKVTTGYLSRYRELVTSGNRGAILEVPAGAGKNREEK